MECYYQQVCSICKVESFTLHQKKAFHSVINKKDVFVNLPSGAGKSLIYQALPKLFYSLLEATGIDRPWPF